MAINANTVYAYACCSTVHGFCKTYEEAQEFAETLEPVQIGNDHLERGYVLTIQPGEISDDLYQGSDGSNDSIILWDNAMHSFPRPSWMTMVGDQ